MNINKLLSCLVAILVVLTQFVACSNFEVNNSDCEVSKSSENKIPISESQESTYSGSAIVEYLTFEEACRLSNTVVTARHIKSEPFGELFIGHSFKVEKTILGKPEKEINVFTSNVNLSVLKNENVTHHIDSYNQNAISFEEGIEYLLILTKDNNPYMYMPVYTLINDAIVRLDDLSLSEMYHMPISSHVKGTRITKETEKEDIISYVAGLTKNNPLAYEYINSDNIDDVIKGSDNIIRIKIDGNHKVVKNDLRSHELYDCTVLEVLKGKFEVGEEYRIAFFPDTVKAGDEWIVAVVPLSETSHYLNLTSKNSLYPCDIKKDIIEIISKTEN